MGIISKSIIGGIIISLIAFIGVYFWRLINSNDAKRTKNQIEKDFEKTADIFYQNMSEPLCVVYHFVVIGNELTKTGYGLFDKLKLVEIDRDSEDRFCRIYFKQEYNNRFIEISKSSPILNIEEDKTTENKIEFNIKFVLAKSSQLINIVDNDLYRNSIILVCNRDESMMSVFVNEDGKLIARQDFNSIAHIERNNFNLYHILTTKKSDSSLKYGAIYPYTYVGDISPELVQDRVDITFKILTRYNPEYVDTYCYDY